MKKILVTSFGIILLVACASTEKLLQRGDYDSIIEKSIKKILKNPGSTEDIELLDKAYNLANQRDLERIKYLKTEGNPDTWDEILTLYSNLKYRQENVRKVLPLKLHGRTLDYKFVDYDRSIVEAKRNAAEYFYNHGKSLMNNNSKESYRQAYYEFSKANDYSGGTYSDLNGLLEESKYLGISRVLVSAVNNTYIRFSSEFMDNLLSINTSGLNSNWIEYHFGRLDRRTEFDYYIDIKLMSVEVSPNNIGESDRIFKKKVQDGFTYVLDKKGNVMKDSLGNDIKVPKYKELSCTVIEKVKNKTVTLRGEVEYLSNNPRRIICNEPVAATTEFHNRSVRAIGDIEALDPETRKIIENRELPFPDDLTMILDTNESLKRAITDVLHHNRGYIK